MCSVPVDAEHYVPVIRGMVERKDLTEDFCITTDSREQVKLHHENLLLDGLRLLEVVKIVVILHKLEVDDVGVDGFGLVPHRVSDRDLLESTHLPHVWHLPDLQETLVKACTGLVVLMKVLERVQLILRRTPLENQTGLLHSQDVAWL